MSEVPTFKTIDPVYGMTVDIEGGRASGLAVEHDGTTYVFCGKGCLLGGELERR